MKTIICGMLKALATQSESKLFLVLYAILASAVLSSCEESSIIGLDVQPTEDLLNVDVIDSVTLLTRTVKVDSLRTDERALSKSIVQIGTYIDPTFGKASASLYTQLALSNTNHDFGANPLVDSVVLALVYDSVYYGVNTFAPQLVNVQEVLEDFVSTKKYYSVDTLNVSNENLAGDSSYTPRPITPVTILGKSLSAQLRVRLSKSFGENIIANSSSILGSKASFQAFIKGLYITTQNTSTLGVGEGNIFKFKMADSQTKLIIYYHNDVDTSESFDLNLTNVVRFSNFSQDYSLATTNLLDQLNDTNLVTNNEVFIQSMAGLKAKVNFPYLESINMDNTYAINKAELIIKIDTKSDYEINSFLPPEKLIAYGIDDLGNDYILDDFYEGENYFDGTYDPINFEYRINISRYIQQVLSGEKTNNGIHLLTREGATNANRAVLGGGSGTAYKMKLSITKTKLPK